MAREPLETGTVYRLWFNRGGWRACEFTLRGRKWLWFRRLDTGRKVRLPLKEERHVKDIWRGEGVAPSPPPKRSRRRFG